MSKNEKDFSNYIEFMSNGSQMYSIIAGFMFTAITLLVTLLPDPSQLIAQATLFSLTVVFGLCLFVMVDVDNILSYCIRVGPPVPEDFKRRSDFVAMSVLYVLGIPIVLMFLLWNLTYLALATVIMEILFNILAYFHGKTLVKVEERFEAETKESWCIRKFFDERDSMFENEN